MWRRNENGLFSRTQRRVISGRMSANPESPSRAARSNRTHDAGERSASSGRWGFPDVNSRGEGSGLREVAAADSPQRLSGSGWGNAGREGHFDNMFGLVAEGGLLHSSRVSRAALSPLSNALRRRD